MEAYKAFVVLFSLMAVARADSSTTNGGEQEAGCIDGESGRVYRLGERWAPAEEGCKLFTCMVDGAVGETSCGHLQASPGCTLVYPKGSYPECCPRLWCPAGVERLSILLSGKAGQSRGASDITGARQDIQHGSSDQEDHSSFLSGATSLGENGPERTQLSQGPQEIPLTGQDQDTRQTLQENKQSVENSGWQSDQPTHYPGYQHQHGLGQSAETPRDDRPNHHASDHHVGHPNPQLSGQYATVRDELLLGPRYSVQPKNDDIASPTQHWKHQESSGWQSDHPTHYPGNQYHGPEQTGETRDDRQNHHASDHHTGHPNPQLSGLHDSGRDQLFGRRNPAQSLNDGIASPAQDWRQQVSHFTSHRRTENGAPGSIAATQTQSFLPVPKESSNRPFDTIFRLFPQLSGDLLQPVDLRSMLSQFNPGLDMSKPQSPLAVFSNIFKLIPGLPRSPEEMLKHILPPGMSPLLPISQDNLIRLIVPDYTPEKPVTILELLNKIISRVPNQITEFLEMPRKLFQLPNLSPNLFQFPSGSQSQQSGSGQETSNPIDLMRRLLPFNPFSSDTGSSSISNNPLGPQASFVQRSPAVVLSNFDSNAPQGSNFALRNFQDKFPSGSQPGFPSFTSIIPSPPINIEQLLRGVGDVSRRPFDTQGPSSYSNPQLQASNPAGGLLG